jgi:KamA family protein
MQELSGTGVEDTSGEGDNTVIRGMQHKYRQTALILTTNQCSMYCRFCFRKRMVGYSEHETAEHVHKMAEYVAQHTEINNVLLSGGDALINPNETIEMYLQTFSQIPTLDFIRIGTRTPVVLPMRIYEDEELLGILKTGNQKKQILIVTHFNHPNEITPQAKRAVDALIGCGCIVRNQTVLLKGISDDAKTLAKLLNRLVSIGVIPYYVFQCRPARGALDEFQVPLLKGSEVVEEAKSMMNGQAKSIHYCMSHVTGKIEILGTIEEGKMLFKYHQAKYAKDNSRIFVQELAKDQCWL